MPQRASARKSARKGEARHLRNQSIKSRLATQKRKFEHALSAGDVQQARALLAGLTKLLQQAAGGGVLHANTAGRRVAGLQKLLNKAAAAGQK
jgi:small subunit ribosomal protein S20